MTTREPDVRVVEVCKSFGSHAALTDVSFEVGRAEFLAILGPSGSGKSTLLNMLGGQLAPDSGRLYLAGAEITGLPPNHIDAATVFQEYALFPHMTVLDNVAFGLRMRGIGRTERRAAARETLRLVDMERFAERSVRTLSGGERQRVATARALAVRPRLLLMDEPLGALDRLIKLQVQREVSELVHRVEVTTIYVTHDQREALTMADRVAVMHDGQLQQIGTPTELVRTPASRFVAEFLGGAGNFLDATVENFDRVEKVAAVETAIGRLVVRAPVRAVTPGGRVSVHVRPEDIQIEPDPRGSGRVALALYTGEIGELTVDLDNGSTLTVKTLGIPAIEAGTRVRAHTTPKAGLILER